MIPDSAIQYWSEIMEDHDFPTQREARNEVFRLLERFNRQSFLSIEGKVTAPDSREFANEIPLYEEGSCWKVGRPLTEYLSNMTSDFSDGTGGEPSTCGSHPGESDPTGLPDYKFLERLKKRKEKLKALIQRRDPDGIEQHIGESFTGYHSSPYSFGKFDTRKEGAHFGTHEQASNLNKPGKKAPKAYELNIQNPLRMPDIGGWNHFSNLHANLHRMDIITDQEASEAWEAWNQSDDAGWEALKQILLKKGYDGIVYENEQEGEGDSYIAFWANQIKPVRKVQEQRLSNEEMSILKTQTKKRRRRLPEAEDEIDPEDAQLAPTPDYSSLTEQSLGWALTLGNEKEITDRARKLNLRLGPLRWMRINEDYIEAERNIERFFNNKLFQMRNEGHSDDYLVGSAWVIPKESPDLWRMVSSVPERTPINLLEYSTAIGLTRELAFQGVHDFSARLFVPVIYFFDIKDYR